MKTCLNLSVIATFVITALSYNVANAKSGQSAQIKDKNTNIEKSSEDIRVFVNNQQRSLYQIALLSGISITELRTINKGDYDNVDVVNIGDSIVLPANSPLLPKETTKNDSKSENKYNLPSLGSSDKVDANTDNNGMERQVATVLQTLGQQDWDNMTSDKLKDDLHTKTQDYAESYVRGQVNSQVIDPLRSAAQDFLGRFGTAQLQFDVSDQAKLNNVNVKLFSPWYDSDDMLIFSQLTYQEYEKDRRIGNFGVGQRWDVADKSWLLGYNVFFDHDFSRNHNRLGLGLEAWSDYMKFAANYYTPLSDWKNSKDFDDYLERAARGFDVRFQGYLPSYPHLGASLMYEQYFGDKVALFGKDNLQKDPYAVTIGVDYTPVPLFTIKGEHKQGESSNRQAKVELTMNYRIGVPLKDQLDPNMVQVARSLKGSRYDLVDRNNYIVLEYKEKKFSVDLASLGEYEEQSIVPITIVTHNASGGVSSIVWNDSGDLTALGFSGVKNGGDLCYNRSSQQAGTQCSTGNAWNQSNGLATTDITNWTMRVPDYIDPISGEKNPTKSSSVSVPGRYTFDVTLTNSKTGRTATSNKSWLSIKPATALRQVLLNNISAIPTGGIDALGSSSHPAPAGSSVFIQANLTNSNPHDPTPVVWPGLSSGSVSGYTDAAVYAAHPSSLSDANSIKRINDLYTATINGGGKATFVDGKKNDKCPSETPNCLLVRSITTVKGSATVSDDYILELSTSTSLGAVGINLKLDNYELSSPTYNTTGSSDHQATTITFSGGTPASMEVWDVLSGHLVAMVDYDSNITLEGTATLNVGREYRVKIRDSAKEIITDKSTIQWSLVGNNNKSCGTSNTILPGDTKESGASEVMVDDLFAVSYGDTYTIPVNKDSLASSGKSSLNNKTVAGGACSGDQGFKLRIDAN